MFFTPVHISQVLHTCMDRKPARSGFTRWISAADRIRLNNI
nr:MAG TPA: ribosomal protein [Caudoviricetes sp.]